MTRMRIALVSIFAIFMLAFTVTPANAATAYIESWSCVQSPCAKIFESGVGNVLKVTPGGKAQTGAFAGTLAGNRTVCVHYRSNGNAGPSLTTGAGLNVSFDPRASWSTVCKITYYAGSTTTLHAWGSTSADIRVRWVSIN